MCRVRTVRRVCECVCVTGACALRAVRLCVYVLAAAARNGRRRNGHECVLSRFCLAMREARTRIQTTRHNRRRAAVPQHRRTTATMGESAAACARFVSASRSMGVREKPALFNIRAAMLIKQSLFAPYTAADAAAAASTELREN